MYDRGNPQDYIIITSACESILMALFLNLGIFKSGITLVSHMMTDPLVLILYFYMIIFYWADTLYYLIIVYPHHHRARFIFAQLEMLGFLSLSVLPFGKHWIMDTIHSISIRTAVISFFIVQIISLWERRPLSRGSVYHAAFVTLSFLIIALFFFPIDDHYNGPGHTQ